jgi:hypothetical protein
METKGVSIEQLEATISRRGAKTPLAAASNAAGD